MTAAISKKDLAIRIGVKSHPVILDIGCHNGLDGQELAEYFFKYELHSFDCDPRVIYKGKGSFYRTAVSNVDGHLSYFKANGRKNNSGSLNIPKEHLNLFPDVSFDQPITVPSIKLDTWHNQYMKWKPIDFIWCDVNGAEKSFIQGARETLNRRTKFLYIEFCEKELFNGALPLASIQEMLPTFELIHIDNYLGNFGNALLQNKDFI